MSYVKQLADIFEKRKSAPPISIKEEMDGMKEKPVILYGAGAFGAENCALFKKHGIGIAAFLDKNAKPGAEKMGVPVYHPDDTALTDDMRKNCTVFISITIPKRIMSAIKSDLAAWGYTDCREVQSVTARQILFEHCDNENPDDYYIEVNRKKIERTLTLMADDESRETYISSIRAHLLREYAQTYETDFPQQYFDAGVPLGKGLSVFADCGAYNGDSLTAAFQHCEALETYIAFEPIVSNFTALSAVADEYKNKIRNAFLFPCGIADETGYAMFNIAASSSAITKDDGGVVLSLVKIDDVIKNVPVTFLKMDIEGAELSALRGAENLIRGYSPDLAISVYHCANHYWDIPCFLADINSNYRFYLRAHTAGTLESVLYCC